ncbi:ASCH domain-containing protein [Vaginella massiliensis]|uniref:ASCH domain-containing protein n=1 Tax=Vaginella massiliensis TaxID=1816680 RepID=UPI00083842B4|nr:ASCH domain-containing protein [Vaginella massiliensis]
MNTSTSTPVFAKPVLPAVLKLTVKKEWFDLIKSGEKTEEYRETKDYWSYRLIKELKFSGLKDWVKIKELKGKNFIPYFGGMPKKVIENSIRFSEYKYVEFKNGYSKDAQTIITECKGITIGKPTKQGSQLFKEDVFIISLGAVVWSNCG